MLESLLIYVCLLPNTEACKNTSQAYVIENKQLISSLEVKAKNMLGPRLVATAPYVAIVVKKEATFVLTRNISVKIKEKELELGFAYNF